MPVHISGINEDQLTVKYITIIIRMRIKDKKYIFIARKFYILSIFLYNILIANDTIHIYYNIIDISREVATFESISYKILISVIKSSIINSNIDLIVKAI